jgi:hypothetical protein
MLHPELSTRYAREQYQDTLREATRNRMAFLASQGRLTLRRRAARTLGHALLRLGASLLRYGLVESPVPTRVPSIGRLSRVELKIGRGAYRDAPTDTLLARRKARS